MTAPGLFVLRLSALLLVILVARLPVHDLIRYGLLTVAVVIIFTGYITLKWQYWLAAIVAAGLTLAGLNTFPAPRIDEGYNFYLPGGAPDLGLPPDVARLLDAQFEAEYPASPSCIGCDAKMCPAQPFPVLEKLLFSADAIFYHPSLSRRVIGVNFSDPVHLRLGDINKLVYNRFDGWCRGIERFKRDRNSLNLFDRFRLLFPLYIVYQFPPDFAGSELCWRGTMLWPRDDLQFDVISHSGMECRSLNSADIGKHLYAVSIARSERLAMALHANATVELRRSIEFGINLVGIVAIIFLLVEVNLPALLLPAILIVLTLLLVTAIDVNFIGGLRPVDDGDDGFAYEGFAREIVQHVMAGDFVAALRGEESVFYFTPGFRYFRALERFVFGDTNLGYLSVMLGMPFLVLALFRRFLRESWALILTFVFIAVPVGVLFGSSLTQYVVWAARGFADPFAFALLFGGIVLIIPLQPDRDQQSPLKALAGATLLAAAVFCRPNLVLASGTLVIGASLITVMQRQFCIAGALIVGFATLAVSPLHNYIFGHSTVLFSDNVNQPQTLLMSPLDYFYAAREVATLNWAGPHVAAAIRQLRGWLSGASELAVMIPLHAAAVIILVRVGVFGFRFNRWLRLLALATLVQHGIGASYVNSARYNLGTWLLTVLITAAWLQVEGLHMFDRLWPGLRAHWAQTGLLAWLGVRIHQMERALVAGRSDR